MSGEISLLAALGLGIFHSLEPGHGKGIMSAYLLSTRAKAYQAILLGLVTAFSHALSIFILAVIATFSIHQLTPGEWTHGLEFISGFFILIIGGSRLIQNLKPQTVTVRTWSGTAHNSHGHDHEGHHHHSHDHDHHHFHYHPKKQPTNLMEFIWVGFLTGIIPCPSALAIILAAVSEHHLVIGAKLVIAFSLGGAFTMATIGYVMSQASEKINPGNNYSLMRFLSVSSALLILLLGGIVMIRAFFHILGAS